MRSQPVEKRKIEIDVEQSGQTISEPETIENSHKSQFDGQLQNVQSNRLRDKRVEKRSADSTLIGGKRWSTLKRFAMRSDFKQQSWWVS